MTKKEARAIISASNRIQHILDSLERQLASEKAYFQTYWGDHIRQILTSERYGCAPIQRAYQALEGP